MTTKEEKTVEKLIELLGEIRKENKEFRESIGARVETVENQLEKKHLPVNLEADILKVAQTSVAEAIKSSLTGYGSPLVKLVSSVVDENQSELRQIISDSFTQVIRTDDFKSSIVSAFSHKVSRSIISNNDGLFDKVGNELKQDAVFKSKMALAVANVVEECLKK